MPVTDDSRIFRLHVKTVHLLELSFPDEVTSTLAELDALVAYGRIELRFRLTRERDTLGIYLPDAVLDLLRYIEVIQLEQLQRIQRLRRYRCSRAVDDCSRESLRSPVQTHKQVLGIVFLDEFHTARKGIELALRLSAGILPVEHTRSPNVMEAVLLDFLHHLRCEFLARIVWKFPDRDAAIEFPLLQGIFQ